MYFPITVIIILFSLLLPSLVAVWLTGDDPSLYLDFPFQTQPALHGGFSWLVWWLMVIFVCTIILPFLVHVIRYRDKREPSRELYIFPLWGWIALVSLIPFWILAWTRSPWFEPVQLYTFTPLWLCYIVIVNAMTTRHKGHCLLTDRPVYLLVQFIISSGFWWYYEFLNGFIRNWHYVGLEELTTAEYVFHSSIAYGTVLPAVISTIELFDTFPQLAGPFTKYCSLSLPKPRAWGVTGWLCGCIILGLAAIFPERLFMCVWIAPLFIITGARCTLGYSTLFSSMTHGDWRPVILPAMAALICGFFWELWNSYSLAHWEYNVPYVEKFYLFEMPGVGYAGYLPFGLVCMAVAELFADTHRIFELEYR